MLDWSVIVSNTLSALVGISVTIVIQNPLLAMPIAASLAILGMFILRCLHPPAAVVALIAALGNVMHYSYAFFSGNDRFNLTSYCGGYLQQYDR